MAWNPFVGKTQEWLEAQLADAQEELALGKSISSTGSGDLSTSKIVHESPRTRIAAILKALNLLDPTTYPAGCWLRTSTTVAALRSINGQPVGPPNITLVVP